MYDCMNCQSIVESKSTRVVVFVLTFCPCRTPSTGCSRCARTSRACANSANVRPRLAPQKCVWSGPFVFWCRAHPFQNHTGTAYPRPLRAPFLRQPATRDPFAPRSPFLLSLLPPKQRPAARCDTRTNPSRCSLEDTHPTPRTTTGARAGAPVLSRQPWPRPSSSWTP